MRADDAGVHVHAHCEDDVYTHTTDSEEEITVSKVDIRLASSVENLTRIDICSFKSIKNLEESI